MDNAEKKNKLKTLLTEETKPKTTRTRRQTLPSVQITGDHAQIAGRDINHHVTINKNIINRPKVEVKTGDGVVTAEQKARLQQLVKDWIAVHKEVKRSPLTHGAAWSAVNKKAKVNSYHEIPAEKFIAIEKWLIRQIAIINAMPSAKTKSSAWRSGRIRAIQSKCNELDIQDKRKEYMKKNFGQDSLTMLSDEDIEKVYRWAMSKR